MRGQRYVRSIDAGIDAESCEYLFEARCVFSCHVLSHAYKYWQELFMKVICLVEIESDQPKPSLCVD